ncbi:MAG: SdrD B-like domain-containing protein [Chitinophagales bacterium]
MKKLLLFTLCCFFAQVSYGQTAIINEITPDPGLNDGSGGEYTELYCPLGGGACDIGCFSITDGTDIVTIPAGVTIAEGETYLIANTTLFVNVDPSLWTQLGSSPANYLDLATCGCSNRDATVWDNVPGERIVMFDAGGSIVEAIYWEGGTNTGTAPLNVNSSPDASCTAASFVVPEIAANPAIWEDISSSKAIKGCLTAYMRDTDGSMTWISDDWPTPGQANEANRPGYMVTSDATSVCSGDDVTFTVEVYNYNAVYTNDADDGGSPRGGSWISDDGGTTRLDWDTDPNATVNFSAATGTTTFTYTTPALTADATYAIIVKENTPVANGRAIECYIKEIIDIEVVSDITAIDYTCDNGLVTVNITPSSSFGEVQLDITNGADASLSQSATTTSSPVTFQLSQGTDSDFSISATQLSPNPVCAALPAITGGPLCVFAPNCPDFDDWGTDATADNSALCPSDGIELCLDGTDLPSGGSIEWVTLAAAGDDPYTAAVDVIGSAYIPTQGISIGSSNVYAGADGAFFAAQDTDGDSPNPTTQTFTIAGLNITGQTGLSFSIDLAEEDGTNPNDNNESNWDNGTGNFDEFIISANIDAAGASNILSIQSDAPGTTSNGNPLVDTNGDSIGDGTEVTATFSTFTSPIAGAGNSLDLVFTITVEDGGSDIAFDNIIVTSNENPSGFFVIDFDTNNAGYTTGAFYSDGTDDYFGIVSDGSPACITYPITPDECNIGPIIIAPRIMPDQTGCSPGSPTPTLPARTYTVTCPTASIDDAVAICDGSSTSFMVAFDNYGGAFPAAGFDVTYTVDGATPTTVTATADPFEITGIATAGIYELSILVNNDGGCDGSVSGEVIVTTSTNPAAPTFASPTIDVCEGSNTFLEVATGDAELRWYDADPTTTGVLIGTGSLLNYTPTATAGGTETLFVRSENADNGCVSTPASVTLNVLACPSVGNLVFFDAADNGAFDAGTDVGLAGITVTLYNATTNMPADGFIPLTTDANGNYLFENVPPGDYYVSFTIPAGYVTSTATPTGNDQNNAATTGNTAVFTVAAATDDLTIDAGLIGTGSIGDFVWADTNGDGIQDVGEAGINGATVDVIWYGDDGVAGGGDDVTYTVTTANDGTNDGAYLVENLPPGNYSVSVTGGTTGTATFDSDGGNDSSSLVTLGDGEDNTDQDFGFQESSCNAAVGVFPGQ